MEINKRVRILLKIIYNLIIAFCFSIFIISIIQINKGFGNKKILSIIENFIINFEKNNEYCNEYISEIKLAKRAQKQKLYLIFHLIYFNSYIL